MNDTIYTLVIQELTDTNANLSLERAAFKARFSEAEQTLAHLQAVLDSDTALKELFEEAEKKLEEEDGFK